MAPAQENIVYIGLGSNKGERLGYLQKSLDLIALIRDTTIEKVSSVYLTRPFGITDQENFFNAAAKLTTGLTPLELFNELKQTEKAAGRLPAKKWGPRELDIDLLFFSDLIFSNDFISLPHKGIIYRDFVLQPLIEIEPELVYPGNNKKLSIILSEIEEKFVIKILPDKLFIPEVKH